MKKLLLVCFCFVLAACTPNQSTSKLKVVTSMFVMTDFVKAIGQDHVEVKQILPEGAEVHDWEPSAKDIAELEKANLFVYHGAELEHWAEDLDVNVPMVEASKKANLIEHDPHAWLDPANAIIEVKNITKALVKADKANQKDYQKNADALIKKLSELEKQFKQLEPRTIVVTHPAFGYWQHYGIEQMGLTSVNDEEEPSPKDVKKVIDYMLANQVKTFYYEEESSPKLVKSIEEQTQAKPVYLHTLESRSKKAIKAKKTYVDLMKENLTVLNGEN